ncbi:sulfatase modifying factor 1 (C-alpha-formyglycine- generating enzyme 1) [Chromatiales bacterium (ex Bugula neritina AB1)]|nr:sulfatase modifying factor 1 (C-alpha-formyglycine- generating enzyme 1) [Chromatiales bacterium (ex Bugula neritina AB1)]
MSCCPPSPGAGQSGFRPVLFKPSDSAVLPASVVVPGGTGLIGTDKPHIRFDGETPLRQGRVDEFKMSSGPVTNADFAAFVADTGYVTEAEHYGWSFVFWSQVPDYIGETQAVPGALWWRRVDGASWKCITGPRCVLADELPDHPVVQVSWNDANAYCSWAGGRLPTELEWEHAARGGLSDVRFPWGDQEPDDEKNFLCNIWQGRFPQHNTMKDGYLTTAPSVSFEPNGYGLYNMAGNVWDWTADAHRSNARPGHMQADNPVKVAKGGSFLCHKSYCYRYRIAARIGNTIDSTTTHIGFRVVWDNQI